MSDWNDVITALNRVPGIRTWRPQPGTTRKLQATISTDDHGEMTMVIDNDSREDWLQLLITVSDTSDAKIWAAAGWCLKDMPTIGLAQIGDGIVIRHGILLPHADPHAITHGINLTVSAATTLYDRTTDAQAGPPPRSPPADGGKSCNG
ncbi:hypothetical protein [Pseudarthrobacter sp. B4EP4b]|uniref:hypothetical protein n=1 Tax=Pseudarthrobacter sp. B4EP4b TaxID=2590664 RepID=UPI001151BF64|nr:hypothetical protein [Pseudarthrobacter sp. B4EP4b]